MCVQLNGRFLKADDERKKLDVLHKKLGSAQDNVEEEIAAAIKGQEVVWQMKMNEQLDEARRAADERMAQLQQENALLRRQLQEGGGGMPSRLHASSMDLPPPPMPDDFDLPPPPMPDEFASNSPRPLSMGPPPSPGTGAPPPTAD